MCADVESVQCEKKNHSRKEVLYFSSISNRLVITLLLV